MDPFYKFVLNLFLIIFSLQWPYKTDNNATNYSNLFVKSYACRQYGGARGLVKIYVHKMSVDYMDLWRPAKAITINRFIRSGCLRSQQVFGRYTYVLTPWPLLFVRLAGNDQAQQPRAGNKLPVDQIIICCGAIEPEVRVLGWKQADVNLVAGSNG